MILVHILALQVELFYLVIYSRLNLATPYRARVKYCDTQDVGYLCSASYNLAVYLTAFGTSSECHILASMAYEHDGVMTTAHQEIFGIDLDLRIFKR